MNQIITATLAFGLIGLAFALLLAFLNRKLKVPEDPKVKEILNILPGLNCGACGFSSCKSYAQNVAKNPDKFKPCRPGGDQVNEKVLALIGKKRSSQKQEKMIVVCRCGAEEKDKKTSIDYQGLPNCQTAHAMGGAIDCTYGCLAFGDCKEVCPANAITIKNKKVHIDQKKCILCGKCIEICPRNLFKMIPNKNLGNYFVACQNKDKLKEVKDVCSRGCIGCGLCTKVENSPYQIKENLSEINYDQVQKKKPVEEGKNKCPTKCIDSF
ncbi:MAG: RnfABCDGE type electron transport complex subunit B [Candidatus Omnitrophica bacterium]|nr:RnfABCDGE type electron transport complex subunit B [Candidatus Omnitrophota bacterium]MCF7893802.1 RnfABCDGE type electron transport complex subunit B [Candidatus Omnitrophota bacterium]